MRGRDWLFVCVVGGLTLSCKVGPHPSNPHNDFVEGGGLRKAAFDLNCPPEMLQTVDLGDSGVGVRGCGRQARYQHVANTGWVLNAMGESPGQPTQPPMQPPPQQGQPQPMPPVQPPPAPPAQ